jgi:hypothetical protein
MRSATGSRIRWIGSLLVAVLALAGLTLGAPAALSQTAADFTDWTSVSGSPATGTLHGTSVSLAGNIQGGNTSGGYTGFSGSEFTPPLPNSDDVEIGTGSPTPTLTFGSPVANPVFHISNLAGDLNFPSGTSITKLSGDFTVSGSDVLGNFSTPRKGTFRLNGTFSSTTFDMSCSSCGFLLFMQVGAPAPPAPPPPPPPPPTSTVPGVTPPPPPAGANLTAPDILTREADPRGRGREYECTQGSWSNLAADPQFTYTWWGQGGTDVRGRRTKDGQTRVGSDRRYGVESRDFGETFFCEVTAQGADGNVVHAVSQPRILTGLSDDLTPPSATKLPKAFGNFRVRGIDVFQVVQPTNNAPQFDTSGPFAPGWCGGGTPTAFAPVGGQCLPAGGRPGQATYRGVTLDAGQRTFARVYVDMEGARTASPTANLRVTLNVEPDLNSAGRARSRGAWQLTDDPPVSTTAYVTAAERGNAAFSVPFEINPAQVQDPTGRNTPLRPMSLTATVSLDGSDGATGARAAVGARDECLGAEAAACAADNTFRLSDIPVVVTPRLSVDFVSLISRFTDDRGRGGGSGIARPSESLLDGLAKLFPGGAGLLVGNTGFGARIDRVDQLTSSSPECAPFPGDETGVRACRAAYVDEALEHLIQTEGHLRANTAVIGVHHYPVRQGGPLEPGFQAGPIMASKQQFPARFTINDGSLKRPITAAAREFGHALGLPNAGTACGGRGESWPDDQQGRLQGIASDLGKIRADAPQSPLFDLMSFCAPEATAWLSALNWDRSLALIRTLPSTDRFRGLKAASQNGRAFVSGVYGPRGARILRVTAADADNRAPAPDPSSPLKVRALDTGGRELAVAGAALQAASGSPETGTFAVGIPAGAAAVELLINGQVADRKAKSRAPRVRVLAPLSGRHVGRGALLIRWAASDPDRDALQATVDFAANGRSDWRAVFTGASTGAVAIPGSFFARSSAGRIRIRVSDGFGEARAQSGSIRTDGTPPTARIITPQLTRIRGRGRTLLSANGLDDRGNALSSSAFTWFDGRRRLGRGATLRVVLPPGRVALSLRARDRFGRVTTVRRGLTVDPVRLELANLTAPARVSAGATSIRVTVATSLAATLRGGGKRFTVGAKSKTLTIPLPRSPRRGVLKLNLTFAAHGARQPGLTEQLVVLRS